MGLRSRPWGVFARSRLGCARDRSILLGYDQGNGADHRDRGVFARSRLGLGFKLNSLLPPIYTYLQFSYVTGTDIDFLNNHNFREFTTS